ncbi:MULTISPECIES: hypothetical protein [Microvirga]|uniref:hypothetical protein n=1 Tax=Microvirga TaxID=186650 RepID=UPI0021CAAD61|nr:MULTISPECIES: hypothetical protein [unclassified Microvirga]
MTHDFKLRNGHRTRALLHAVSLINAQACKPLYERRSRLLSDIVHCAYQIGTIASERYKAFEEFTLAGLTENTSELEIGALASHLLGYVEIAHTYRSVWGVWIDHCSRPGFLTFQLPEGAMNRQPMAGEILNFKRVHEGGRGGSASFLPVASLSWALSTEASGVETYQASLKEHVRILEEEICPAVMAEFAQVPAFVQAFNDCVTYQDIVKIFPAVARILKADDEHRNDNAVSALLNLAG